MGTAIDTATAQQPADPKQRLKYQRCILLSKSNPDAAFDMALTWKDFGGGEAASHCIAAALIGLKIYNEAAVRLETLAQISKAKPGVRAGILSQAAQAWLLDGNAVRAESVLKGALELQPDDANLWIDRAVIRADMKKYANAIKDLTQAIKLNPTQAESYVFRASAYRHLKNTGAAKSDAEHALRLDADHVAGLLERGILRRLDGDQTGARADWLKVLTLAPDTPAAASAQANLEKMDVKKP